MFSPDATSHLTGSQWPPGDHLVPQLCSSFRLTDTSLAVSQLKSCWAAHTAPTRCRSVNAPTGNSSQTKKRNKNQTSLFYKQEVAPPTGQRSHGDHPPSPPPVDVFTGETLPPCPWVGGARTEQQQVVVVRTPGRPGSGDTGSQQRAQCSGGSEGSGRRRWARQPRWRPSPHGSPHLTPPHRREREETQDTVSDRWWPTPRLGAPCWTLH